MADEIGSVLAAGNPDNVNVNGEGGGAAPAAQPPAQSQADWLGGLDEQARGFVENKGWKEPKDLLESYRNLESFVGKKGEGIVLPENDDPEAWAEVFNKLGRPEAADGYTFQFPEGADEEFTNWAKETFHSAGLTDAQFKSIGAEYMKLEQAAQQRRIDDFDAQADMAVNRLRTEWGEAFQGNLSLAARGVQALGLDDNARAAIEEQIGSEAFAKTFLKIGEVLCREDRLPDGERSSGFGPLSPAAAQERIAERMADEAFVKRYMAGEQTAMAEMERLHKAVAAGKQMPGA